MASFSSLFVTQLAIGAVASVVVYKLARPLLVEVIRAGYVVKDLTGDAASKVKDLTEDAASKVKSEFTKIAEEAKASRQPSQLAAKKA